jgi:hypothetical protein
VLLHVAVFVSERLFPINHHTLLPINNTLFSSSKMPTTLELGRSRRHGRNQALEEYLPFCPLGMFFFIPSDTL